ncbi:MAG: electron transfer flavoprotein subunit alpha/FixB family protein [Syntrophorhabdaceae bacterium]|nr:electron transfer flavoprotein subunit alpha/FixB family protein [Syntrophorhabdaceae bacterium]
MSYALIVSEVRRGQFDERNLDSIGFANLAGKAAYLLVPQGDYAIDKGSVDLIIDTGLTESAFLNPLVMVDAITKVIDTAGMPDLIVFTHSSSGVELATYTAGRKALPIITDVSGYDKNEAIFYKSYYSDKVFGQFRKAKEGPVIVTVRSGSFREFVSDRGKAADTKALEGISGSVEGREFIEYVEEAKTGVDITKAEFLLSLGRGIGNKDEIPVYEELAGILKATISGSRPVIDKQWLPKERQVGTSGKTVKPKVYLAMGISGAFQHIAGMKDSDCIIAVNKDPDAPIFQYAHYGIIGDANKVRDKLKDILKG